MKFGTYKGECSNKMGCGDVLLTDGIQLRATPSDEKKMQQLGSFMYEIVNGRATNIRHPDTSVAGQDGVKYDEGKLRMDLIPPVSLMKLAEVYTYGAGKYADNNWCKGLEWGRVYAAMQRHLWKFWAGEENDEESGLHHLAHAAWSCFTLLDYLSSHPELDNRRQVEHEELSS